MFVFKYISHLVTYHFCIPDFRIDIGMRMSVNPCIDTAAGYQFCILSSKCTVQYGTFMLRSNNLQSRQVVSNDHYMFCRTFGKTFFDMT